MSGNAAGCHKSRYLRNTTLQAAALIVGLMALIAAVYSNSLACTWQLDDYRCIVDFDYAHATLARLWRFSPQRLLGFVSFWLNYKVCGYNVPGWHVANIVLHMLNVLVVFGVARWLFRASQGARDENRDDGYATWTAAAAAAIFAVHPVQTHTVTYIVQRLEMLGTLWAMLAFWCACRAIEASSMARRLDFWLVTAGALVLGALSKETIVVAPVLVCAYLVIVRTGSLRSKMLVVVTSMLVCAAMAVAGLIAFKALQFSPSFSFSMQPFETLWYNAPPAHQYYPTQVRVLLVFLRLCVLPYGQRIEYVIEPSASFMDPAVILAAAIHLVVIAGAALMARRRPVALFGVVWFYAFLAPSSALPNGMFEHRLYGALAGIVLAIAVPLGQELRDQPARMRRTTATVVVAMAVCLILCFGVRAHLRNRVWLTEESMWRDAVANSPNHWRANVNLGKALMTKGSLAEARFYLEKAFDLEPTVYLVPYNLGVLYHEMGLLSNSASMLEYTLMIKPDSAIVSNALGVVYADMGRMGDATNFLACVGTPESFFTLAELAAAHGKDTDAVVWCTRALALEPYNTSALRRMYLSLRACGRTNDAEAVRMRLNLPIRHSSTNLPQQEH